MPRRKVTLAFINDNYARKNSLKKRKECLKKKLDELTTLCGVDAGAIIYTPNETETALDLWPNRSGVENVLEQLRNVPEMEQSKKSFDRDAFIKQKIKKTREMLKKQNKENRDMVTANKMSACWSGECSLANLNVKDLNDIVALADDKVSELQSMIELLKEGVINSAASTPPPPDSQPMQHAQGGVCGSSTDGYVPVMENDRGSTFDYGIQSNSDDWLPEYWFDHMGNDCGSSSRG